MSEKYRAVVYVAELCATQHGPCYYVFREGGTLCDYPAMNASIVAIALLVLGLHFEVDWLER